MQVGDLVKVVSDGLRVDIGSVALITEIKSHTDARGTMYQYWALMTDSDHSYFFQPEHLEVISASR